MTQLSRAQASLGSDALCLDGQRIKLIGLQAEHADTLFEIGSDPRIWRYLPRRVASRSEMTAWVAEALRRRDDGVDLPFVIRDRMHNRIIGETRLIDYVPEHRQIEIAWTWFAPIKARSAWIDTETPKESLVVASSAVNSSSSH